MYINCALSLKINCTLLYTVYRCFYGKCTDISLIIIALTKKCTSLQLFLRIRKKQSLRIGYNYYLIIYIYYNNIYYYIYYIIENTISYSGLFSFLSVNCKTVHFCAKLIVIQLNSCKLFGVHFFKSLQFDEKRYLMCNIIELSGIDFRKK